MMEVATTKSNQALSNQALKPVGAGLSGPDARWEMIIPKMARPAAAPRPQRSLGRTPPPPTTPPSPAAVTDAETPTEISFYAGSEASFVPRRWRMLSLCAAVAVVGCVIAWVRPSRDSTSVTESTSTAAGTWSRRVAYLVGGTVPREILIYSGSEDVKNYRIEFGWVPDSRGVGWIFRGTDSANYYAANLRLIQAGARPSLSAEHFTVVKGVEGTHSRRVITLDRTGPSHGAHGRERSCLYVVSAGKSGGLLDRRAVRDREFRVLCGAWRKARAAGDPFHVFQKERSSDRRDFTAVSFPKL